MAEALVTAFRPVIGQRNPIEQIVLLPSSGGRFEVMVDGDLIFSKAATHEHTSNEYVISQVRKRLPRP